MEESQEAAGDAVMAEMPAADGVGFHQDQDLQQDHGDEQHQVGDAGRRQEPASARDSPIDTATATTPASSSATRTRPPQVAAAFPKKRRGRPPGRPNATVRDADYEDNPLVQVWNAAKIDRAVPVVSVCIRDALTERSLVHETQRAIFRMPSRETIVFVQGWITARHIASQRPSYVNGLLIHSRGHDAPASCAQCAHKRARHALGPFLTCRVLPGSYHNSCSNCKWFDNTSACSLYTGPKPNRKRKAKDQPAPPPPTAAAGAPAGIEPIVVRRTPARPEAEMAPLADVAPVPVPQGGREHQAAARAVLDDGGAVPDASDQAGPEYGDASGSAPRTPAPGTDDDLVGARLAAELLPEIQRPDP